MSGEAEALAQQMEAAALGSQKSAAELVRTAIAHGLETQALEAAVGPPAPLIGPRLQLVIGTGAAASLLAVSLPQRWRAAAGGARR